MKAWKSDEFMVQIFQILGKAEFFLGEKWFSTILCWINSYQISQRFFDGKIFVMMHFQIAQVKVF